MAYLAGYVALLFVIGLFLKGAARLDYLDSLDPAASNNT